MNNLDIQGMLTDCDFIIENKEQSLQLALNNSWNNLPRLIRKYVPEITPPPISEESQVVNYIAGATGSGRKLVSSLLYSQFQEENIGIGLERTLFTAKTQREYMIQRRMEGVYTRMIFVGTESPMINIKRVNRDELLGHHGTNAGTIYHRFFKSLAGCVAMMPFFNELFVIDNSEDGKKPELILQVKDGVIKYKHETRLPKWVNFFIANIEDEQE